MTTQKKSVRPSNLLSIKESQVHRERPMTGFGLWRLGFRPFYLGAASFSALAIMLWLGTLIGIISLPTSTINPLYWHAHEMVFGFAFAVIAGFLLTASNNWTGILPAAGRPLAIMFLLWLAARVFILFGYIELAAVTDLSFALLLILLLGRVLWLAKIWKNFMLLGLVGLMSLLNLWFYINLLDQPSLSPLYIVELALLVILQLLVVMGGRVIPMFTQNGISGVKVWKPDALVSVVPIATMVGIIGWLSLPPRLSVVCCAVACLMNLIRWAGWKPWKSLKTPMVWVLQLGYLFIPLSFVMMALNAMGYASRSLPVHTIAVGAMGLIIAGMITRTAMGHTGRQIKASSIETTFFILIAISAVLRVCAAIPAIQTVNASALLLSTSGLIWSLGFLLYLWRYTPWLIRPRIDGRPG